MWVAVTNFQALYFFIGRNIILMVVSSSILPALLLLSRIPNFMISWSQQPRLSPDFTPL